MFIWFIGVVAGAALISLAYLVYDREQNRQRDAAAKLDDAEQLSERKRRAKRLNERLKLASSFSSGLGAAFVATSVLAPLAGGSPLSQRDALLAVLVALILHVVGQFTLHFWKGED